MLYVLAYDITDDRRRQKMSELLEAYGARVQFSVFECDLNGAELEKLVEKAKPLLNYDDTDSLRVYGLCEACAKKSEVHGFGSKHSEPPVAWIV